MKYFILILFSFPAVSQTFKGKVVEKSMSAEPLAGAIVQWLHSPHNPVMADIDGNFEIIKESHHSQLIISMIGYQTDTLSSDNTLFSLSLSNEQLKEVVVKSASTSIDQLAAIQTQIITTKELAKAACCNLSESFETNASVSTSYSDAITGAKQMEMLGLSGKYIQTNIENMPGIRGLSLPFGLNFVPGTWIQSIDLAKGVSSVINGYESMSGAINVELQKPDLAERVYLNAYLSELGRGEVNLNLAKKINKKWSTALLSHGSFLKSKIDRNNDDFLDLPTYHQLNFLNRWKYTSDRFMGQIGLNYVRDIREGGQTSGNYLFGNKTEKITVFSKTAILFPEAPYRGLGLILNANRLGSESKFGPTNYDGDQQSFLANLIYQDIFGSTMHTYKTGLSFMADHYQEDIINTPSTSILLDRNEIVPGAFFEYTYNQNNKTLIVAGLRFDQHNLFGPQWTPRLHIKQDLGSNITARLAAGRGFRVPVPFAENYGQLTSNRVLQLISNIEPEISWNFGGSLVNTFGKNTLILDFYHTLFSQQLVMDMDRPALLDFYVSKDKSFASSLQAEWSSSISDALELKLAYRWLNVKQTMRNLEGSLQLRDRVFVPKDMGLVNLAYTLPYDKWKADLTLQYRGKQRIPSLIKDQYSPRFMTVNSQISRSFVNWEYYLGAENLFNFKQTNPIISPENPNSATFDAGQIWGPVVGRVMYLGMRFRVR